MRWAIEIASEATAYQVGAKWRVWVCCMCIGGRALALPHVPDIMQALAVPLVPAMQAVGRGPQAALKVWQSERRSVGETRTWLEEARMEAVLGSRRRSLPSVRCACMIFVLV